MLVELDFYKLFENLQCEKETRAYISGVFNNQIKPKSMNINSIVLYYIEAKESFNFEKFQNLADWILYTSAMFNEQNKDLNNIISKSSYFYCYRMMNRKWKLFEELSDDFEKIKNNVKKELDNYFNNKSFSTKF